MKQTTFITGLATMLPSFSQALFFPGPLAFRRNDPPYQDVVCKPHTGSGSEVPPCVEIENIENACKPNETEGIDLEAHAQCMCGGSFFAEKLACERCLFIHGLRSGPAFAHYNGILLSASDALCTGTPTAAFDTIYSNIQAAATPITTGATATSDLAPNDTAISLYYTASGPQGPGSISGGGASAAGRVANATGTDNYVSTYVLETATSSNWPSTTGTAADHLSMPTVSVSFGNGAMPACAAGGLVMGAAGLAVLAGL